MRDNDTIIGFGSLFLIYKLRGTAAIIEDLAVKKERRRQRWGEGSNYIHKCWLHGGILAVQVEARLRW